MQEQHLSAASALRSTLRDVMSSLHHEVMPDGAVHSTLDLAEEARWQREVLPPSMQREVLPPSMQREVLPPSMQCRALSCAVVQVDALLSSRGPPAAPEATAPPLEEGGLCSLGLGEGAARATGPPHADFGVGASSLGVGQGHPHATCTVGICQGAHLCSPACIQL